MDLSSSVRTAQYIMLTIFFLLLSNFIDCNTFFLDSYMLFAAYQTLNDYMKSEMHETELFGIYQAQRKCIIFISLSKETHLGLFEHWHLGTVGKLFGVRQEKQSHIRLIETDLQLLCIPTEDVYKVSHSPDVILHLKVSAWWNTWIIQF